MAEAQDYIQSLSGGQNQSIDPFLLRPENYAKGINMSVRGGLLHTRPPLTKLQVEIPAGKFQGAKRYDLTSKKKIIFGVSGCLYSLNLSTLAVTSFGKLLDENANRFFFCQTERYMVVQDGIKGDNWEDANWPVIIHDDSLYDQSALRSSDPEKAFPKGASMAYAHGRVFVSTDYVYKNSEWIDRGRVGFVSGDLISAREPESILQFEESTYLNEGGRIILPQELGTITQMVIQQNIQTGTGQGPLLVAAEKGFAAYQIDAPRSQWLNIDIGTILYYGHDVGTRSPDSIIHRGGDVFYRANDGLRTMMDTGSKNQNAPLTNTPLSGEIHDTLSLDDLSTLPLVSAAASDNHLFVASVPDGSNRFKSFVSVDLLPMSSMSQGIAPVYDGEWTGLRFHQIFDCEYLNKETVTMFADDENDVLGLYRLEEDGVTTTEKPFCRVYTGYKNSELPLDLKELKYVDMWVSDIVGEVSIKIYYRPDGYQLWGEMPGGTFTADSTGLKQKRVKIRFTPEDDIIDNTDLNSINVGYAFQFCIEWQGNMKLVMMAIRSEGRTDPVYLVASSMDEESTKLEAGTAGIELDDYNYRI